MEATSPLFAILSFGRCPPVGGLTDADLDSIVAFVREAQEREGFEPYPP